MGGAQTRRRSALTAARLVAMAAVGVGLMVWGTSSGDPMTLLAGAGLLAAVARHRPDHDHDQTDG